MNNPKPPLVDQPTNTPTRKVALGNTAGTSSTAVIMAIMLFGLESFYDPMAIPERWIKVLPFLGIAVQGVITFWSQFFIRNRADNP